jgi:hypothetical protein
MEEIVVSYINFLYEEKKKGKERKVENRLQETTS